MIRFKVAGLEIIVKQSALVGSLIIGVILFVIGLALLKFSLLEIVIWAVVGVALYWLGELIHQLGHAWAARSTGYPMYGIRFGTLYVLGTSLYPRDEPPLPGSIHIRRALGGPIASLIVLVLSGIMVVLLPEGTLIFWLAGWVALTHIFIYFGGALLPLGFTDGSTILRWWNRRTEKGT